jgi:hypothetical protein
MRLIMLNPSTADADEDDPTIRRCISFAERSGFGAIWVTNLFALRATDPRELLKVSYRDAVGPLADLHMRPSFKPARVVCAWGKEDGALRRLIDRRVYELFGPGGPLAGFELECLALASDGSPRHPLMLPNTATLQPWKWRGRE